jgi:hypothetical protein
MPESHTHIHYTYTHTHIHSRLDYINSYSCADMHTQYAYTHTHTHTYICAYELQDEEQSIVPKTQLIGLGTDECKSVSVPSYVLQSYFYTKMVMTILS